jgi:hypothetical protein
VTRYRDIYTVAITKADCAALENLWGDAGTWAADTWTRLNATHFDGQLRYHGIVWGLTPHGGRLGHTSRTDRITLHPALLDPQGEDPWLLEELRVGLGDLVARMVAFVRAGYPQGVPETDYVPLLALLRRPLSDDEVAVVARELAARGEMNLDAADIGVAIMRITDELPSADDLDRVQRRLEAIDWPVDPNS